LEEGIDFGHGDQSAQVGNVTRFCLEKEKKVAIFLCFLVIGEESFLRIDRIVQAIGNFILL
jgi:hypothetical protein